MNGVHTSLGLVVCEDARDAAMRGFDYAAGEEYKPIRIEKVVVVRNGTQEGRPTVDFVLQDESGQKYVFVITGSLLKSIPCLS